MSENGETSWNNTHRAFLQCLFARQSITYEEAKPLLAAIETAASDSDTPVLAEDISEDDFENYINTVSRTISPFDYEIRSTLHQKSKQRVWVLVNTTSDALTRMATMYSADEIAFIRRVLVAMFDTFNTKSAEIMAVTGMEAVRLAKAPRDDRSDSGTQSGAAASLTGSQAERVLAHLLSQSWLEKNERTGFYCLSPRALTELQDWLIQTFNDDDEDEDDGDDDGDDGVGGAYKKIKMCSGCQAIVTIGQRCPNMDCLVRLHGYCTRDFFLSRARREEAQQQCPGCQTIWRDPPPVGEEAARQQSRGGNNRYSTG